MSDDALDLVEPRHEARDAIAVDAAGHDDDLDAGDVRLADLGEGAPLLLPPSRLAKHGSCGLWPRGVTHVRTH